MSAERKILAGPDNPDGLTLEEVTAILIKELYAKNAKFMHDKRRPGQEIYFNNAEIISHLRQIKILQGMNSRTLELIAPTKPGVGIGSM